jgi:predicted nucleotidyltransferase
MVQIIEAKREQLAALCRQYGVVRLYLFGSALREDFRHGESDIDLLVDFGSMDGRSKAHAYFDLLDELQSLFGTQIDLVMVGALKNRYIAREVESTKQVLYAA